VQGARRGRLGAPGRRQALAVLASALALTAFASPPAVAADPPPAPNARAWILVDAADGEVLAAHRAKSSYPIASTTKLMTAFVARKALGLGETVVAPAYVPISPAESLLGLEQGERIEVRDLLYGLLLASGNDAALALAEGAAGSEPAFVRRMNRAAAKLGLDDTSYANPIGLDEPGNYSSAEDLADLAIELRTDPVFRRIFDTPEAVLHSGARPRTVVNRNNLVRTVPYVNGVKTGYTLGAANVLVGSAEGPGVEMVSVVLGAPTESDRDSGTLALLDYGLSLYSREIVVREGEREAESTVRFQDRGLGLLASERVALSVRKGQRVRTIVDAPVEVEGPIERGERLGRATVTVDGEPTARVALEAAQRVPEASTLERFDSAVPGPRLLVWLVAIGVLAAAFAAGLMIYDRRRS
jgi:serine-type D-Ala-D-Ala carboxypeptidase (penicillin-binding protein 5/6)